MAAKRRIGDAGKVIPGARKDAWRGRAMEVSDLDGLSPEVAAKHVAKDQVWPVDYAALIDAGMPVAVAALVKTVRDRMAAKPNYRRLGAARHEERDPAEVRRDFVRMTGIARDALVACRTPADVDNASRAIRQAAGCLDMHAAPPAARDLIWSVYVNSYSPFSVGRDEVEKAAKLVGEGFPGKQPAWRKDLKVKRYGELWYAQRGRTTVAREQPSEQAALDAAKAQWESARDARSAGPQVPDRPHLDVLSREGMPDHRGGRDVDPSEFIDVFKFAGVQFGKWLPQDERQNVMNLAFDGLMDLAWVMGVPPGAIGFGKRISVAFGARGGGGKHNAHYEAEERIFNFTRFSGAGNVAHEWAHAYDHIAGEAGLEPGPGGIRSGTGWRDWTRSRLDATAHLGETASKAWDSLVTSLRVRPLTREQAVEGQVRAAEGKRRQIAMREAAIEACLAQEEGPRPGLHATRARQLRREIEELLPMAEAHEKAAEALRARGDGEAFGKAPTTFLHEALLIGGGKHGYWTRPNEMFARAFEAVAYDRVVEAGGLSDYLVHGVGEDVFADKECYKGNPYPTGAERESLRQGYACLFDAMRPRLEALAEDEADLTDAVMVRP